MASSTRLTRSQPATLRGSSASTQPIARTGKASTVKRKATLTSSVDADRALPQPERADHQHGEGAEAGQRLQQRVEDAAQPADRDQRVAQLAGPAGEPGGLLGLPAHRLDHQRAVEALVGDAADLGAQPLRPGLPGGHPAGVDDVEREQRGEDREPDQGERPVGERRASTTAPTSITSVPTANGSGAIGYQAASTSELALDSRVPVALRWCQDSGSSR